MTSIELENLAKIGKLKREPPTGEEVSGLLVSADARLKDAQVAALSYASRFDLAYNAAHALALVALRRAGFRAESRYLVFQTLQHTVGLPAAEWRVLSKAHERRNLAEYEGHLEQDDKLLAAMIDIAKRLRQRLEE
ncbi:MAG TPA: hypothetical protein VFP44_06310 [Usitatibacter sp.]|nr:hypothetical protein [Usitatibacter sp.]